LSRSRWFAVALLVALAGAAYAVVGREPDAVAPADPEPAPASAPRVSEAPPPVLASRGNYAEEHRQRMLERAEEQWAEVLRLQKDGRLADALAVAKRLKRDAPDFTADKKKLAVVDHLEAAINSEFKRAELEKSLATAKLSDAQRAALNGQLAATAEILARSANEGDLDQLTRHLRRFLLPGAPGSGDSKDPGDVLLRQFIEDRRSRRGGDKNPPIADADVAEQRRVDELEKLRQRDAVGLLDSIHAGLAWLALHQKEDGSFSDQAVIERCATLKHDPGCMKGIDSTGDGFVVAATGLAILAFLDFRDQDPHGWFDPYLGRGIEYLKKAQKADGTWPGSGQQYSNAIALMALSQASASTGSEELRDCVRKGLAWFDATQGPLGGFRYVKNDTMGDLSVTAWVAQAVEAARNAGIEITPKLSQGFEIFLRYVWTGSASGNGAGFSYIYRRGPSPGLATVGMLVGHVVGVDKDAAVADLWKKYLLTLKPDAPPELYALYYGVRLSILMNAALEEPYRTWTFDLAKKQIQGTAAAGSIPVRINGGQKAGLVVPTALAVLTFEHALYLR
jgi:hypothetical protein